MTNKTPRDWYGAWRNQFYLFDILEYIENNYCEDDNFIILDSDCIFTNSCNEVFNEISQKLLIAYKINYEENHNIKGISINDMKILYEKFYYEKDEKISYYGGEFIGVNFKSITDINKEYVKLWKENYNLYEQKEKN